MSQLFHKYKYFQNIKLRGKKKQEPQASNTSKLILLRPRVSKNPGQSRKRVAYPAFPDHIIARECNPHLSEVNTTKTDSSAEVVHILSWLGD